MRSRATVRLALRHARKEIRLYLEEPDDSLATTRRHRTKVTGELAAARATTRPTTPQQIALPQRGDQDLKGIDGECGSSKQRPSLVSHVSSAARWPRINVTQRWIRSYFLLFVCDSARGVSTGLPLRTAITPEAALASTSIARINHHP